MKIFLDDIRDPPEGWIVVRTYNEIVNLIDNDYFVKEITDMSFDHDLGEDKTGYDVLCFIEELVWEAGYKYPKLYIHSANPVGRKNMEAAIAFIEKYDGPYYPFEETNE